MLGPKHLLAGAIAGSLLGAFVERGIAQTADTEVVRSVEFMLFEMRCFPPDASGGIVDGRWTKETDDALSKLGGVMKQPLPQDRDPFQLVYHVRMAQRAGVKCPEVRRSAAGAGTQIEFKELRATDEIVASALAFNGCFDGSAVLQSPSGGWKVSGDLPQAISKFYASVGGTQPAARVQVLRDIYSAGMRGVGCNTSKFKMVLQTMDETASAAKEGKTHIILSNASPALREMLYMNDEAIATAKTKLGVTLRADYSNWRFDHFAKSASMVPGGLAETEVVFINVCSEASRIVPKIDASEGQPSRTSTVYQCVTAGQEDKKPNTTKLVFLNGRPFIDGGSK
jgi:hypothetical protein